MIAKKKPMFLLAGMMCCLWTLPVLAEETPAQLIDRMEKLYKAIKSYEMTSSTTIKAPYGNMEQKMKMWGIHKGDLFLSRVEGEMSGKMMDQDQKSTMLNVSDGTLMWVENHQGEQVSVTKMKASKPGEEYQTMRDQIAKSKATIKPSEQLNGETHAVLEVVSDMGGQTSTSTYWFNEKNGIMAKMVMNNPMSGDMTFLLTEVKVDVNIPEDKFTYTPPAGVTVQDMTNMGGNDTPKPADAPKTESEKTPEKETEKP